MTNKARTPWFPTYASARLLYPLLNGTSGQVFKQMQQAIGEQMGTPENPVDWTRPQEWIPERLSGELQEAAWAIWHGSGELLNPRHLAGPEMLGRNYKLLDFTGPSIRLTESGQRFVNGDATLVHHIDEQEGLIALLGILAGLQAAQRKQILPEWMAYLQANSSTRSESVASSKLYDRLVNLIDRGLVQRDGNKYALTPEGMSYVGTVEPVRVQHEVSARRVMNQAVLDYVQEQRTRLRQLLSDMHPTRFEQLVGDLLSKMGYENAEVTQQSGDLGIDVVATAKFGITTVKEVVQVKRKQSNVQRPVVDQLRGVLPLHGAIRGTIITVGDFSPGAKDVAVFVGAAPITLIDGETLMDLLIEHKVGVNLIELPVMPFAVNDEFFSSIAPSEAEEVASA